MSIEGRLVQEQHSSGVQCGGRLNPDASLGIEGLAGLKMGGIFNAKTQGRNGPRRENGIRRGWVSQPIGRGNPAPTIADISVTGDSILPLAPAGRHVYSRAGYTNTP